MRRTCCSILLLFFKGNIYHSLFLELLLKTGEKKIPFHFREKVKEIINYHRASAIVFFFRALAMAEMLSAQGIHATEKVSLVYQMQKVKIFLFLSSHIFYCENEKNERDYRVLTPEPLQMLSLLNCKLLYMWGHGWFTWTLDLMGSIMDVVATKTTRLEALS